MKDLRISIIIPAYNEERYLPACLEAIAAQTVKPYEVIVVDNNSSDKTAEIARNFPFVKLISESRQGIVYARSLGFNAASGEIIGRIDADTILPAGWIERVQKFYAEPARQRAAFTGGARFIDMRWARAVSWLYNFLVFDFNRLLIGYPSLWGSNMAITAEQWRAVRNGVCRRVDIHEDMDLTVHLRGQGYQIYYDRCFPVIGHMRRVYGSRKELWSYLQWWPRTLRIHGKKSWPICWFFGAFLIYLITPMLNFGDYLSQKRSTLS